MASSQSSSTPTVLLLDLLPKTFVVSRHLAHPAGFHLLYTGTDASLSIRHGHWFHVSPPTADTPSQTLAWQWNREEEQLESLPEKEEAVASPNVANRGIVNYDALREATSDLKTKQTTSSDPDDTSASEALAPSWSSLTTHISSALLTRIIPQNETTYAPSTNPISQTWPITSLTSTPADAYTTSTQIPGLTPTEVAANPILSATGTLSLLPIDLSRTFPSTSTGSTRTSAARDRSWYLSHLIDNISPSDRSIGASQILGELQLTFLTILTLSNYSALSGWKRLLSVLLTCTSALSTIPAFFTSFTHVLRLQVCMFDEVEGGLFELSESAGGGAWLRKLLRGFRRAVDEAVGDKGELEIELGRLETIMRERYGWDDIGATILRRGIVQLEDGEEVEVQLDGFDEEEETGEWAPVVVEI